MARFLNPQKCGQKPWKYLGYREYVSFVASDNDFFILRRFSRVSARVLLALQDEISELEDQLDAIDLHLADPHQPDRHNGSFRQETSETRLELIQEIHRKLRSYNELVIQHSDLRSRPQVHRNDINSISNWHINNDKAILKQEANYISHKSDLFAISPKYKAPLRRLLEKSSHFRHAQIWKKETIHQDESIIYTSDDRIDLFVSIVNTTLGMAMLAAPLWILAYVEARSHRLIIITTFLVCFLCLVSFTTISRPFESLGATAAYAAVLAVFLQASNH